MHTELYVIESSLFQLGFHEQVQREFVFPAQEHGRVAVEFDFLSWNLSSIAHQLSDLEQAASLSRPQFSHQ